MLTKKYLFTKRSWMDWAGMAPEYSDSFGHMHAVRNTPLLHRRKTRRSFLVPSGFVLSQSITDSKAHSG